MCLIVIDTCHLLFQVFNLLRTSNLQIEDTDGWADTDVDTDPEYVKSLSDWPSQRHFVEHFSHVQSDKIKKFSVSQTAEFESILERQ